MVENELGQRIETALRTAVPFLLCVILALVSALPLGPPALGPVMPILPAIAVFYWAVYRPDLLPKSATFVVGLIHDGLTGAPPGTTSLMLLVLQALAGSQRRFFNAKPLVVVWFGFALIMIAVAGFGWLIACVYYFQILTGVPVAIQALLTIAVYPVVAWPFAVIHRDLLNTLVVRPR